MIDTQTILDAARRNDDNLDELLQEAIKQLSEEQANSLLDQVHQIMKESLQDLQGWKQ